MQVAQTSQMLSEVFLQIHPFPERTSRPLSHIIEGEQRSMLNLGMLLSSVQQDSVRELGHRKWDMKLCVI
jgi:hypothetical protein